MHLQVNALHTRYEETHERTRKTQPSRGMFMYTLCHTCACTSLPLSALSRSNDQGGARGHAVWTPLWYRCVYLRRVGFQRVWMGQAVLQYRRNRIHGLEWHTNYKSKVTTNITIGLNQSFPTKISSRKRPLFCCAKIQGESRFAYSVFIFFLSGGSNGVGEILGSEPTPYTFSKPP